jgi:hypothetical protein
MSHVCKNNKKTVTNTKITLILRWQSLKQYFRFLPFSLPISWLLFQKIKWKFETFILKNLICETFKLDHLTSFFYLFLFWNRKSCFVLVKNSFISYFCYDTTYYTLELGTFALVPWQVNVSFITAIYRKIRAGNTKGGSITVLLTSCLTGWESAVWELTIFVFICKTD